LRTKTCEQAVNTISRNSPFFFQKRSQNYRELFPETEA